MVTSYVCISFMKAKQTPFFRIMASKSYLYLKTEDYVKRETDYVVCLVDMDRLLRVPAEMATYQQLKKKSSRDTKVPVTFVSGTNNFCILTSK